MSKALFQERHKSAREYFSKNLLTTQAELCTKFGIGANTANKLMAEVFNETKLDVKYIVDPEHEIKNLDWKYNPEREIRNLPTPQF